MAKTAIVWGRHQQTQATFHGWLPDQTSLCGRVYTPSLRDFRRLDSRPVWQICSACEQAADDLIKAGTHKDWSPDDFDINSLPF